MNRRYYCMFIVLFFAVLTQAAAAERTFNILFIQSYTSQTPWHSDLNQGLAKGFKESGLKVNITTEYLDADFWAFNSEKVIMRRFCQRARDRQTDLIVTASDEAFYTLFACGDSLPLQIPVVFFGIKYPDTKLITTHPNVCGFTANPDFDVILRQAQKIFPRRKEVVCVIDNSFLSNKGLEDFEEEWKKFLKKSGWTDIVISLVFILFGIMLIARPEYVMSGISLLIGLIFIAIGILKAIDYFSTNKTDNYLLAMAIVMVLIGVVLMFCSDIILSVARIVIAIWILYSGILNLQTIIVWKDYKTTLWIVSLILAIATIGLGMYVLVNPGALLQTGGIAILIYGIVNIIENMIFIKKIDDYLD